MKKKKKLEAAPKKLTLSKEQIRDVATGGTLCSIGRFSDTCGTKGCPVTH